MTESEDQHRQGTSPSSGGLVCIGECMVELARTATGQFQLSYGGDTFNTAVYARRAGLAPVAYMTAVGDDLYSDGIVELAAAEAIDTGTIARAPGRRPGLYLIETEAGERTFTYWRDMAPARRMFDFLDRDTVRQSLAGAGFVYISGITLSVLEPDQRDRLAEHLASAKLSGALIVMDANYRPAGWPGGGEDARSVMSRFWRMADIAMPGLDDEAALWGETDTDAICERLHGFGCQTVVLKDGPNGAVLSRVATNPSARVSTERVPCPDVVTPRDTTAAGDSFNGGFLAALHAGAKPEDAIHFAHRLAGEVVGHPGAIVPAAATARFAGGPASA
jgi:2-dehydro-3-deoxygluconokinase